jgi:hypothetical protein
MFIIESNTAKAAKKMSILMGIAFAVTASFGVLLTMHIYVKPHAVERIIMADGFATAGTSGLRDHHAASDWIGGAGIDTTGEMSGFPLEFGVGGT